MGETFVDFDTGLNTAVRKLRSALGDESESPRYIETLPKRGYRFLAPWNLSTARCFHKRARRPERIRLRQRMDQRMARRQDLRRCRRTGTEYAPLAESGRSSGCGHAGHCERSGRVAHLQPARLLLQLTRFRADFRF